MSGPEYLEYLAPSDDEISVEDQPLPVDASPTALLLGYVADSNPEDPEEDPADYPIDEGEDDEEEESSEDDDEEEEEHLALADSTLPAIDFVPSAEETEPFETDESTATPPPPRSPQTIYAAAPTPPSPPPYPLSPWSSPFLHVPSPPLPLPSPPLLLPSTAHMTDIPEAEMPPQKRACFTAPSHRFIDTLDASIRASKGRVMTTVDEVNGRMSDLATTHRQDAEEIYMHHQDARTDISLLQVQVSTLWRERQYHRQIAMLTESEARYAREAWSRSEGRSTALEAFIMTQDAHLTTLEAQVTTL
ncbi:hypothetical protein Tco_1022431 [Tanacetum coccineum]